MSQLVSWSLTSLFSTNMAISETKVMSQSMLEDRQLWRHSTSSRSSFHICDAETWPPTAERLKVGTTKQLVLADCRTRQLGKSAARTKRSKVRQCHAMLVMVKVLRPTQHKIGHFGDVPQASLFAWYGKKTKPNTTKAHIHQSKQMYYNTE